MSASAANECGCVMAHTLDSLRPGIPVFAGTTRVGEVRAVYAAAETRSVELVVVAWSARGEDVAIPAAEIESIEADGVHLMRTEPGEQSDLAPFDEARFTHLKRLA